MQSGYPDAASMQSILAPMATGLAENAWFFAEVMTSSPGFRIAARNMAGFSGRRMQGSCCVGPGIAALAEIVQPDPAPAP
jgi:hypothetical protein